MDLGNLSNTIFTFHKFLRLSLHPHHAYMALSLHVRCSISFIYNLLRPAFLQLSTRVGFNCLWA
jgi:hypothetical protein